MLLNSFQKRVGLTCLEAKKESKSKKKKKRKDRKEKNRTVGKTGRLSNEIIS